jgi:MoaA/NifB/PqqE/SkfB family radical SAM enzyme
MNSDRHFKNFSGLETFFRKFSMQDTVSVFERALDEDERVMLWLINDECNLNCDYCHNAPLKTEKSFTDAAKIAKCFDDPGYTWFINISGGEPFLYPGFTELMKLLTKNHYISLNTNLTAPGIPEFSEIISPAHVPGINASYQAEELRKHPDLRDIFISNYILLQSKGFNIIASYVAYPPFVSHIPEDLEQLKKAGVSRIGTRNFNGIFEGKNYPESYTEKERKLVKEYSDPAIELDIDNKFSNLKGRKCTAGQKYIFMDKTGNAARCTSIGKDLGNLFNGDISILEATETCSADKCICTFEGLLCSVRNESV